MHAFFVFLRGIHEEEVALEEVLESFWKLGGSNCGIETWKFVGNVGQYRGIDSSGNAKV